MKNRDGLENSNNWKTPDWLYNELNEVYHFDFDPCPLNHDLSKWDGLKIEWGKSNFVNPPYDRDNKPLFITKAFQQYELGKTSVLLIPSATGTKQFHSMITPICKLRFTYSEWRLKSQKFNLRGRNLIIFMEGRISFEGINTKGEFVSTNKGKHDSMIVVFDDHSFIKKQLRLTLL